MPERKIDMGQYKGKRESSHPEKYQQPQKQQGAVSDPFADKQTTFGDRMENMMMDIGWFFRSKKGKILVGVLCSLLVIGVGSVAAFKIWMSKPPELPQHDNPTSQNTPQPGQNLNQQMPPDGEGEQTPSDDELYPDDGYGGDMPEVSGERKEGVYTFLLVGTDKDDGNTDTIMVASYDTVNQTINIMSIPRDTMINESWDIKKINSVYARTGYSIDSLANRIKKLIGFKPDYYVKVELGVFVELVDLVGGVEFYVPCDMNYDDPYQDLHIHLKEGLQVLDGEKAMQLVRFRRYKASDIQRIEVQQAFMKALIEECLSLKHWGKIKAYIDLALENVQTNLDFGSIVWFAANVMGLNHAPMLDMDNVNTCTLPGDYWGKTWSRATNQNQSYVTIYPNQVVKLVNESFNPYKQNVTTAMLDAMSILKNGDIASSTGVLKDTQHNEIMAVMRGEAYYDEEGKLVYGSKDDSDGEGEGNGDEPTIPDDGEGGETGNVNDPDGEGGETDPDGDGSGNGTDPNGEDTNEDPNGGEDSEPDPNDGGSGNETDPDGEDANEDPNGSEGGEPDPNGGGSGNETDPNGEDTTGNEDTTGGETDGETGDNGSDTEDEPVIDEPTIPDDPAEPEGDEGDAQ